MISTKEQEELFRLIADYLEKDIGCAAVGGTAMMFLGYKSATKDIDLVFGSNADRNAFAKAIEILGYRRESAKQVYGEKRAKARNAPLVYSRGDERFDLFAKSVFGLGIEFSQEKAVQRRDYLGKKEFSVLVPRKELLVLLKAVTERERDYEDIEAIAKAEPDLDWEFIISEAVRQRKGCPWILVDLEEKMQKLRKTVFIKQKHFDAIYKAEGKQK